MGASIAVVGMRSNSKSGTNVLARASHRRLRMRTVSMLVIFVFAGIAPGAERPRLDGREAPRATDLLRAETLSRQAEGRLRAPSRRGRGWVAGGGGFGTNPGPSPGREPSIVIHTAPSRGPRAH